jgi:hypothetical protein
MNARPEGRKAHEHEAGRIQQTADDQHAERAETIGQPAREWSGDTPCEVLDRNREREGLAGSSRAPS